MRDDQCVGGGVQEGDVHIHFLVLESGDGVDLGHEEDEVAGVNVVAEAVNDEEEVGPVLGWAGDQGGQDLFLLLNLGNLLCLRDLFLLWFLLLVLLSFLLLGLLLLRLFLLLGLFLLLFLAVSIFGCFCISISFSLQGFRNLLNLLGIFLFGSKRKRIIQLQVSEILTPRVHVKV